MISRPIQFRAWNRKQGMFTPYFHGSLGSVVENESIYYTKEAMENDMSTDGLGDYPTTLMQFTGLKDKNGKEIYEGDILVVVELHDGDEGAWVQPKGPAIPCEVKWENDYLRFDFGGCGRVIHEPSHFEVIGNIYENKEVLK